jgi:hypothetical protein
MIVFTSICTFHMLAVVKVSSHGAHRDSLGKHITSKGRAPLASSPKRSETAPFIGHGLFQNLHVYVETEDSLQTESICKAMKLVGAVVQSSKDEADVIVSSQRVLYPVTQRPTRGAKLVASVCGQVSPAKNVLVSQIPWVSTLLNKPIEKERKVQSLMVVVADIRGTYRPHFSVLNEVPKLCLEMRPRGYTSPPFDNFDSDPDHTVKKHKFMMHQRFAAAVGPEGEGYCDLCDTAYLDAQQHRASIDHQRTASPASWKAFDALAREFNLLSI